MKFYRKNDHKLSNAFSYENQIQNLINATNYNHFSSIKSKKVIKLLKNCKRLNFLQISRIKLKRSIEISIILFLNSLFIFTLKL